MLVDSWCLDRLVLFSFSHSFVLVINGVVVTKIAFVKVDLPRRLILLDFSFPRLILPDLAELVHTSMTAISEYRGHDFSPSSPIVFTLHVVTDQGGLWLSFLNVLFQIFPKHIQHDVQPAFPPIPSLPVAYRAIESPADHLPEIFHLHEYRSLSSKGRINIILFYLFFACCIGCNG